MIKKLLLLIVFCLNFSYAEDLELKKIFDEFHLKGTLVIFYIFHQYPLK